MSDQHRDLVERFQQAMFVQHDAREAASVYAEDAVLVDPAEAGPIRGRQAIEENLGGYLKAFPDVRCELRNLFSSGEWFAAELTMSGSHNGPLVLGPDTTVPATGKPVELNICWVGRVQNGLCVEDHTYYDSARLMEQLGLMEQQATATA